MYCMRESEELKKFTSERNNPLDRQIYGTISHQGLRYNNPFSPAKMEEMIELLDLNAHAAVLDIGSGKAELLIRLVERYQVSALGLELDASGIQEAREQAAARIPSGRLELRECDAVTFEPGAHVFDFASCVGACHIYHGLRPTLEHLARFVRPGGKVLVGDGYWKQEPAQEYLAALSTTRDEFQTHAENVAVGVSLGLLPLYASACNEDEWDRFEWLRLYERATGLKPDDPGMPAHLAELFAWRDLYLRLGRDTLGFGLYLFQK
jgi:SAM-dependent methyltransferase